MNRNRILGRLFRLIVTVAREYVIERGEEQCLTIRDDVEEGFPYSTGFWHHF